MDMKRGGYPLRIFLKIIHKLDNTIDPKTKVTMIEAKKFKSHTPMQKIQRIKSNPQEIKIDRSLTSNFANPIKINKKIIKIDKEGKITITPQLLRSMSTRSNWGEGSSYAKEELKKDDTISMTSEMSRMSFKAATT